MSLPHGWIFETGLSSRLISLHVRGVREGMKVKELIFLLDDALCASLRRARALRAHLLQVSISFAYCSKRGLHYRK